MSDDTATDTDLDAEAGDEKDLRPAIERIKEQQDGLDVLGDLLGAARDGGYASLTPDQVQLAKWWGIYPQRPEGSGYLMLRVRVPNGAVTSEQLRAIAQLSIKYGRSLADVTTRQCLQLHWLTVEDLPDIFETLDRVGLTSAQACGDVWRNVVGCPLAGVTGDELFDSTPVVNALNANFTGNRRFSNLPRKFKVSVCSCTHHCAQHEINDIGLVGVIHPELGPGYDVFVGGGLGSAARIGRRLDVFVTPEQAIEVAEEITAIYRDNGNRVKRTRARIKFLVDEWGPERYREVLEQRLGRELPRSIEPVGAVSPHRDHIGVNPQSEAGVYALGGATLRGRTTGGDLLELATIAERHGRGRIRFTNRQNVIVLDVPHERLEVAMGELADVGFPIEASSFRRQTISCTGIEFCRLSLSETKEIAAGIIDHLEESLGDLEPPVRINVNGCPNACAQYQVADIGLQGALAKKNGEKVMGFQLHLGGRLGENPRFGKRTAKPIPSEDARFVLERLVGAFKDERGADETFGSWLDRQEPRRLQGLIGSEVVAMEGIGRPTASLEPDPRAIVPVPWLAARLEDPSVEIVEVSDDGELYGSGHIPGAIELDLHRELIDPDARPLPVDQTRALLGRLGIAENATIVVYGDQDNELAAYAVRLLLEAGHADVRLLDGGRRAWIGANQELTREVEERAPHDYPAAAIPNAPASASADEVLALLAIDKSTIVVDLRDEDAFLGADGERAGHIPGAVNIPLASLVREDGTLLPRVELLGRFEEAGVRPQREVVLYSDDAITAGLAWVVVSRVIGVTGVRVLDAGFDAWSERVDLAVASDALYESLKATPVEGD
ncbi:MAG: rhodanese-like domain-containing protein [Actinobacteria bacterium]|nr:rhodanese-like domain-containing protein [Actinomycetota bacterium]